MTLWMNGLHMSTNTTTWFVETRPAANFSDVAESLDNLIKEFQNLGDIDIGQVITNLGQVLSSEAFMNLGTSL